MDNIFQKNEILTNLESLNREIKNCKKCRLSATRSNAICGEGNINSRLFLIAQAPGETEDRMGRMFLGPTGKIIDELFGAARINRNDIYMTNLIKCMLPGYRKPLPDETEICGKYLDEEIRIIKPDILVPLGNLAARYVFRRYHGINNLSEAGIGRLFYSNGLKIYPLRHPSSLLYNPQIKADMIKQYTKMAVFQKECKWYPVCPMKYFFEQGKLDKKWIELYCKGDWLNCVRYQMEENFQYHPDNMLPDGSIDKRL